MIYKYNNLIAKYGSRRIVDSLIQKGTINKLSYGKYSTSLLEYDEKTICQIYKCTVITGKSAFYFHGLSTYAPEHIYVSSLNTSTRISINNVRQTFQTKNIYDLGMEKREGMRIYNLERCLIELFRYKKQYTYDYYKEIVESYRKIKDQLDMYSLRDYLSHFKYGDRIFKEIMEVIF